MSAPHEKPYIGITGFMDIAETRAMIAAAEKLFPRDFNRRLMVGVLASLKTLRGKLAGRPNRYPKLHDIRGIFIKHDLALNLIHYATKEPETLCDQLLRISGYAYGLINGFQLNIAWPDRKELDKFLTMMTTLAGESWDATLVLQVGRHAMEMVENSPEKLAAKVSEYEGLVKYVLLDPSCGRGEFMNPREADTLIQTIKAKGLKMGIGVAGGLSELSVESIVGPLAAKYPDLSIDAESKLRDIEDHLNLLASENYIKRAVELFTFTSWPPELYPKPTS